MQRIVPAVSAHGLQLKQSILFSLVGLLQPELRLPPLLQGLLLHLHRHHQPLVSQDSMSMVAVPLVNQCIIEHQSRAASGYRGSRYDA